MEERGVWRADSRMEGMGSGAEIERDGASSGTVGRASEMGRDGRLTRLLPDTGWRLISF